MQSPVKKIHITQGFGENPQIYSRWGLLGHNGEDFRAFHIDGTRCYEGGKSPVYAPHDGTAIECLFDADGYGNYLKIENNIEGSLLAHFSSLPVFRKGDQIKIGQFIGYQGSTGFSTGIHLHWGYYRLPRNRNNGYNGYINQAGLYDPYKEQTMADTIQVEKTVFENLVKNSSEYDELVKTGYVTQSQYNQRVKELEEELSDCRAFNPDKELAGWVKNGITTEVTTGNTKIITNYKLA